MFAGEYIPPIAMIGVCCLAIGVMTLVLYGDQTEGVLHVLAEQIREELLQDESITQVDLEGIRDIEISVSVSQCFPDTVTVPSRGSRALFAAMAS